MIRAVVRVGTLHLGRNALFVHVFDNRICFATNTMFVSTLWKSPGAGIPLIDSESLNGLRLIDVALQSTDDPTHERISLGLRWYDRSFSEHGVDALLSAWFAIESVGMTSTNVGELHQHLADAYGITKQSAQAEFQLGKIFGLRAQIVHDGARPPIHVDLVAYLQAVFIDLVRYMLGQPPLKRARQALSHSTEQPTIWLPKASRHV